MLQLVVMTVNVTSSQASLAVRIVCAEKLAFTAPPIPIVSRVKSAVTCDQASLLFHWRQEGKPPLPDKKIGTPDRRLRVL